MKTIKEINEKIKKGKAVVLTAKEVKKLGEKKSPEEIAKKVDVVTTATFGPMCSSGVFLNFGHPSPATKMQKVTLDGVPAYGGVAAVDVYLGATEEHPENRKFGGAHVIYKLINGEEIFVDFTATPSDCYPGTKESGNISLKHLNQAYFYNPRNCYQNYNAATNSSGKDLFTYMGKLNSNFGSVNYAGSGEISPLLNDPELKTIGIGTRIFFCGGDGYIAWEGTQFNSNQVKDNKTNLPIGPAATLAITGDLRQMSPEFVKPIVIPGYGVSLSLAIGIPIPILNKDIAKKVLVKNSDIKTNVEDYATGKTVQVVNYQELLENSLYINGKKVQTKSFSNNTGATKVLSLLKEKILSGDFLLTEPVAQLPFCGKNTPFGQV